MKKESWIWKRGVYGRVWGEGRRKLCNYIIKNDMKTSKKMWRVILCTPGTVSKQVTYLSNLSMAPSSSPSLYHLINILVLSSWDFTMILHLNLKADSDYVWINVWINEHFFCLGSGKCYLGNVRSQELVIFCWRDPTHFPLTIHPADIIGMPAPGGPLWALESSLLDTGQAWYVRGLTSRYNPHNAWRTSLACFHGTGHHWHTC